MEKTLIVCVGLPRSGKSTWSRAFSKANGFPIVNPDSVRLAIHGEAFIKSAEKYVSATVHSMVHALFLAGHDVVILDATNTTRVARDMWKSDHWKTVFHVFDASKEECLKRCKENYNPALPAVIERMAAQWQPLEADEKEITPLGPTGLYPDGESASDDDGELTVSLGIEGDQVRLNFGTSVKWLALGAVEAIRLGELLADKGRDLNDYKEAVHG